MKLEGLIKRNVKIRLLMAFLLVNAWAIMLSCFLVGCESADYKEEIKNNVQESVEEVSEKTTSKFVGVWKRSESGSSIYCCISSSGIAYLCNASTGEIGEISLEDKNIYEYEIVGDTISLVNEKFNNTFRLQGDILIGDEGEEYQRSEEEISIYRESEDGEGQEKFLETVNGRKDQRN